MGLVFWWKSRFFAQPWPTYGKFHVFWNLIIKDSITCVYDIFCVLINNQSDFPDFIFITCPASKVFAANTWPRMKMKILRFENQPMIQKRKSTRDWWQMTNHKYSEFSLSKINPTQYSWKIQEETPLVLL